MNKRQLPVYIALSFIPVFFIGTTIIGVLRNFSPIPFWDMWDTYVQFSSDIHSHTFNAFWSQANEHRIVLTKILFLVDLKFFGGKSAFLIASNIALMFSIWATLTAMALEMLGSRKNLILLCSMVSAVFAFSWLQKENITWANQSQFFMAYLLPLFSLYQLAKWIKHQEKIWLFYSAAFFGVLSTVTMANGLITPVLLVALAALGRKRWDRYSTILSVVAVVAIAAWMYHYSPNARPHTPLITKAHFVLVFLGAPGTFLLNSSKLTLAFGLSVIGCGAAFLWLWLRGKISDPMFLACLIYLAYVGATAAGAASGRAYSAGNALASRYETPVLTGYASIVLMLAYYFRDRAQVIGALATFLVASAVIMFQFQLQTLEPTPTGVLWQKQQAALALNLGIEDQDVIWAVYPQDNPEHIRNVQRDALSGISKNASVFGEEKYRLARTVIGKTPKDLKATPCAPSAIDITSVVRTAPSWTNVQGWAINSSTGKPPLLVLFVEDGKVTGVAFSGFSRPDVAKGIGANGLLAGYQGYNTKPVDKSKVTLACIG